MVEIAFAGHSNVGKSSLINTLVERKNLVRASSTPGSTRQINLYEARAADGAVFHLVDLPGYGFTTRIEGRAPSWGALIEGYLATRVTLAAVVVLVDVRRGLEEDDRELIDFIDSREGGFAPPGEVAPRRHQARQAPAAARARRRWPGVAEATRAPGHRLLGRDRRRADELWRALRKAALGRRARATRAASPTKRARTRRAGATGEKRLTFAAQIRLHGRRMSDGDQPSRAERDALDARAMQRIRDGRRRRPRGALRSLRALRARHGAQDRARAERGRGRRPRRVHRHRRARRPVPARARQRHRVARDHGPQPLARSRPPARPPRPDHRRGAPPRAGARPSSIPRTSRGSSAIAHAVRPRWPSSRESQRETLEIAFFEGLSYPEIAEREKIPLGTVKSRAARALTALRAALDGASDAGYRAARASEIPRTFGSAELCARES